jgi:integrase
MGLGAFPIVSLINARAAALECRQARLKDLDPILERLKRRARARLEAARTITFKECARQYIESHKAGWRSEKHSKQWNTTLDTYAHPVFGSLSVQEIDTPQIVKALAPIWSEKSETAKRVRQRIELIFKFAIASKYREGENPARWAGCLEFILDKRSKNKRAKHHSSMPHQEVGAFVASLREEDGAAAAALEFVILTAARTNEVLGARWEEINFDDKVWEIPANRMKIGVEHAIPLSQPAITLLQRMEKVQQSEFVFPGGQKDKPLTNMAMLKLRDRMNRSGVTIHGFRGTFCNWANERTTFSRETIERALAHTINNKAEAAYNTTTLVEKRRPLMERWSEYCALASTRDDKTVVQFGPRGAKTAPPMFATP